MGGSSSKAVIDKATENITKSVSTMLNKSENKIKAENAISQDVRIVMKYARGCDINVNQTATITAEIIQFDVNKINNNLDTNFVEKVIDDIEQSIDQTNEGINLGQVNDSELKKKIRSISKVDMEKSVKNIFTEQITSYNKLSQNQVLEIYECFDSNLDLDQYASIDGLAERISEKVLDTSALTGIAKEYETKLGQATTQSNIGLFGGIGGIVMMIVMGVMAYYMFTAKKKMIQAPFQMAAGGGAPPPRQYAPPPRQYAPPPRQYAPPPRQPYGYR